MGRFSIIAALALGVLLGAGAVLAWAQFGPGDDSDLTRSRPAEFSQPRLAQRLMARVARKLIAAQAQNHPMSGGAVLFDQPKPYGGVLCSVRAYAFPAWIVRGRADRADAGSPWQDDLRITERYTVWKEPGAAPPAGLTPEIACARLHDFQHLILGEGTEVDRDVALIDRAVRDARAGTPGVTVTCTDNRSAKPVACDGLDILRRASVRRITQVGGDWDGPSASPTQHVDKVFMEPPAKRSPTDPPQMLTFQLSIAQGSTGEDELRAIRIARDRLD